MGKKVKKSKIWYSECRVHTAACNHQPRMKHCMSYLM